MIEVRNLQKQHGAVTALRDISFLAPHGSHGGGFPCADRAQQVGNSAMLSMRVGTAILGGVVLFAAGNRLEQDNVVYGG